MPTSYTTGTVSITNGSTAVTGVGTAWTTNGVQAGDIFEAGRSSMEILSVNSATSITLLRAWADTTLSTVNYSIRFVPQATRVLTQINTLLAQLANGILSGLSAIASPAADKLAYLTGASTWAIIDFKTWARTFIAAADQAAGRTALGLGTIATQNANALSLSGIVDMTGGQLKFPVTQLPSADANTLDDYEEGIWTPDLLFGGGKVGMAYSINEGSYTKIGRLVTATAYVTLSAKGSSTGSASMAGLPFNVAAANNAYAVGLVGRYVAMQSLAGVPIFYTTIGQNSINFRQFAAVSANNILDTNFTDTSSMMLTVAYRI